MLYNARYCSRRVALPSHISSQNRISESSLMEKEPRPKKNFFVAMSPAQKYESPGFQRTRDNAFWPIYFLLRMVCQVPSSVSNLNSYFPSKAVFLKFPRRYKNVLVFKREKQWRSQYSLFTLNWKTSLPRAVLCDGSAPCTGLEHRSCKHAVSHGRQSYILQIPRFRV
jgi:hypothetical protein